MMYGKLVVLASLAILLSSGCSKKEAEVPQSEPAEPPSVTSQPPPATVMPAATETGTVTQTSLSTISEQVVPAAEPVTKAAAPTAAKPPAPAPRPATPPTTSAAAPPPAIAPATATTTPAAAPAPPATQPPATATAPPAPSSAKPATRASSGKAPKTHTIDREGIKHAPGDDNATQKCSTCHGKELKGGKVAKVSCFECHDQNWK